MASKKRYSWPIILALALHLTILGLFGLSALLKPDKKELEPVPDIIHAEIVDETQAKNPVEASAEPVKQDVEKKDQETEAERAVQQAKAEKVKAEATKAKTEAAELAKADVKQAEAIKAKAEAKQAEVAKAKAEAAAQAKAEAKQAEVAKAKAEAAEQAKAQVKQTYGGCNQSFGNARSDLRQGRLLGVAQRHKGIHDAPYRAE